jgi:glyoxylase-like metal-dependent hydrolase (beta-lactamase superfamily II)
MTSRNVEAAPRRIASNIYMVGGPDLSDPRDCLCYLINAPQARVLIDCGAGASVRRILELVNQVTHQPITHLLLTHNHIDHVGGAAELRRLTACQVLIHGEDAQALVEGDPVRSAANWYGINLEPVTPDQLLEDGFRIRLDQDQEQDLTVWHTPGHTPGSCVAWCQVDSQRILFGQDIHGPFSPAFASNIGQWKQSMQRLLVLQADILAEGHYGVFMPAPEVQAFLKQQLASH